MALAGVDYESVGGSGLSIGRVKYLPVGGNDSTPGRFYFGLSLLWFPITRRSHEQIS